MLRDKLDLALIAGIVIAVCGILIYSPATVVKAAEPSLAINIVDKVGTGAVEDMIITFPEGAPEATVSNPFNNVNGPGDPQVLSIENSEPVVRLHNTSDGALLVTLEITVWTNEVVVAEDYELVVGGTTNVAEITRQLSAGGGAASEPTGESIGPDGIMDLYLEVVLNNLDGKSGESTLSILGEVAP